MTIWGTCHFVSKAKAAQYYREYCADLSTARAMVAGKIAQGEIKIGKPNVMPGDRLIVVDSGTRYAVEED